MKIWVTFWATGLKCGAAISKKLNHQTSSVSLGTGQKEVGGSAVGGGNSGPASLYNFPRLHKKNNLTVAPRHLERSSQYKNCNRNAAFQPLVFTNGLEIEFYLILTPR